MESSTTRIDLCRVARAPLSPARALTGGSYRDFMRSATFRMGTTFPVPKTAAPYVAHADELRSKTFHEYFLLANYFIHLEGDPPLRCVEDHHRQAFGARSAKPSRKDQNI